MNEARVRPIDANKLMRLKRWVTEYDEVGFSAEIRAVPADDIDSQPTLDYAPVVHAHWVKYTPFDTDYGLRYCSECLHFGEEKNKYCPNCGARMDGERE